MPLVEVNFATTTEDSETIAQIVDRVWRMPLLCKLYYSRMDVRMDIAAVHLNDTPLRLADLLAADDFNFTHDIGGIHQHLNRDTGRLDGRFSPRFSDRSKS